MKKKTFKGNKGLDLKFQRALAQFLRAGDLMIALIQTQVTTGCTEYQVNAILWSKTAVYSDNHLKLTTFQNVGIVCTVY